MTSGAPARVRARRTVRFADWGVRLALALSVISALVQPLAGQDQPAEHPQPTEPVRFSPDEAAKVAADRFALTELRVQAIGLLSEHRTQHVAGVLVDLTAVGEPTEVRGAAFTALAALTSVHDLGADEAAWRDWWAEHRDLPAEVWYQGLLANFRRNNADLAARQEWAQNRLIEAERVIYEAMPSRDRPAKLITMLGDPLEAIRLQGLEFTHRRLVEGDPPGDALTLAVRDRLDDNSSAVRRRAALLLRDLANPEAADLLARRLVVGTEKDPAALRAYLLMLAQTPRKEAVAAALDMLADTRFSAEAASMLAAAAERQLLDERQADQAARICREYARDDKLPDPQAIALLGLIGSEADWVRIEQWLDSDDEPVKEAAALAWGRSKRPLLPLIQRASDLVIRPNALVAAAKRGSDTPTLIALVDSRLEQDQRAKDWEDALVAMARRVPPRGVLQAEQELARVGQPIALRDRLISAAIDAQSTDPAPRSDALVDLLLLRAELRLDNGDFQGAVVDYKRLAELGAALDAGQQRRHDRGLLRARLAVGYIEGAVEIGRRMLENTTRPVDPDVIPFIVDAFGYAVDRNLEAAATQRAQQTLAALRTLFGENTPDTYRDRLNGMDVRIRRAIATQPPGPPAAPPPAATTAG